MLFTGDACSRISIVHEFVWTRGRGNFTSIACVVEQDTGGCTELWGEPEQLSHYSGADLGKKKWGALEGMNLEKQPIFVCFGTEHRQEQLLWHLTVFQTLLMIDKAATW